MKRRKTLTESLKKLRHSILEFNFDTRSPQDAGQHFHKTTPGHDKPSKANPNKYTVHVKTHFGPNDKEPEHHKVTLHAPDENTAKKLVQKHANKHMNLNDPNGKAQNHKQEVTKVTQEGNWTVYYTKPGSKEDNLHRTVPAKSKEDAVNKVKKAIGGNVIITTAKLSA